MGAAGDPLAILQQPSRGAISIYAQGADYHDVLKAKLKPLAARVQALTQGEVEAVRRHRAGDGEAARRARRARLAGQAHQPRLARVRLVAVPRLDLHHRRDRARRARGRSLRRLPPLPRRLPDARLHRALPLDARACISYLTIEHKGHIAPRFREAMGNRIFGCDDCLAVCPWNKFAQSARETKLSLRAESDNPPLAELLLLDDAAFRARFRGTPIKRTGRDRFLRNVLIAAGNSGDATLVPLVEARLEDASPLVRAMAVWALSRLAPQRFRALRAVHADDPDPAVRSEWMGVAA